MKNTNNIKGGEAIASGGFGCVFSPSLKCKGTKKRDKNKISKLMTKKHAIQEYKEINEFKKKLKNITNFEDYFLLNDITICQPAKLSVIDLKNFNKKCTALPKDDIDKKNINSKLDEILSINMPNGGIPVDDFIYENGSLIKLHTIHVSLLNLLKNGIIPMNKNHIYHADIKDSNILVSGNNSKNIDNNTQELKTRLIDWGLSTEYIPFKNNPFPKTWRNRPFQFNVPFSVIIFSDDFVEKYTKFIKEKGLLEKDLLKESELKPFVTDFIIYWMKKRGAGHYKFINEIMYALFSHNLTSIESENKPKIIETQITMTYIVNYIVDVLIHFTKFRENGTLNLRDYFDNLFIQIVDIWGFICVYYPIIELLNNNYSRLNKTELKIFNKLKFIFVEYLFNPRHSPIDINSLYEDFNDLGKLMYVKKNAQNTNTNTNKTKSILSNSNHFLAGSIKNKTKKIRNNSFTQIIFKRIPKQKHFKKPIYLNIK